MGTGPPERGVVALIQLGSRRPTLNRKRVFRGAIFGRLDPVASVAALAGGTAGKRGAPVAAVAPAAGAGGLPLGATSPPLRVPTLPAASAVAASAVAWASPAVAGPGPPYAGTATPAGPDLRIHPLVIDAPHKREHFIIVALSMLGASQELATEHAILNERQKAREERATVQKAKTIRKKATWATARRMANDVGASGDS